MLTKITILFVFALILNGCGSSKKLAVGTPTVVETPLPISSSNSDSLSDLNVPLTDNTKAVSTVSESYPTVSELDLAEKLIVPLSATADSSLSGFGPEQAIREVLGFMWNAGSQGVHWIRVDLGAEYDLTKINLRVAQYPAGYTVHQIYAGMTSNAMILLSTLSGYTVNSQVLEVLTLARARYVTVMTLSSPSWVAWEQLQFFH